MPATQQTVRVFISSTFRDMHAERDHLVTVVFPELRERVEQLGLEFFDVDLRWGVPAKDANGETAHSWEYCRQWIDRVEPFFVCILGRRYGWVPEAKDFRSQEDKVRQASDSRSITDLEVRHAVLNDRRKRRSYFYLRETPVPELPPDATEEQRQIHDEFVDPPEQLTQLDALKADIRGCGRPVRGYECRWTGKEFADLDKAERKFGPMVLEDLWSGVLRDERYVGKEVWRQVLGADPDIDPRYTDESQPVPRELWQKIVALARPAPVSPLEAEREQMDAFAASRLRWFQGRTTELQQLTDFLHAAAADAPRLAVVAAVPGQGKSALLAHLHEQLKSSLDFVITHFVGATERSATAHALVERLLAELDRSGIQWPADQPEGQAPKRDFSSLCLRLAQRLGDYAGERRIVILLDALNQLSDGHDLQWLPSRLGPSVRAIASCIEDAAAKADNPEQRVLQALASRQPPPLRVPLGPLTKADVRTIVVAYLKEYCHELDREHLETLCSITQAHNPLYLLVMLGELRTLGGNDLNRIVPALIASMPQDRPDTVSLFRWVLRRLEVFGREAVEWWCLYLAHGRIGMASHELSDLLARKLGADAAATALRIERGLRRYLQRRGPQLDFFHSQLRQAVLEKYGHQTEPAHVHSDVATYFQGLADPAKNYGWNGESPRPFLELPFHLARSNAGELAKLLSSFNWLQSKTAKVLVQEMIEDFHELLQVLPPNSKQRRPFELLQGGLRLSSEAISKDKNRLAGQIVGRLSDVKDPMCEDVVTSARSWRGAPWLMPLVRNLQAPGGPLVRTISGHLDAITCLALSPDCKKAISAAHDRWNKNWDIKVWDLNSGRAVQTLSGHRDCVNAVIITQDGRLVVSASHDTTLKVWELETGAVLKTLHGHDQLVDDVALCPDGRKLVSSSYDNSLKIWDLEKGLELATLTGPKGTIRSIAITADGATAISTSKEFSICFDVWDLQNCTLARSIEAPVSESKWAITPDGSRAIMGTTYGRLWEVDLLGGRWNILREANPWGIKATSVVIAPDGRTAAAAFSDGLIGIYDLAKNQWSRWLKSQPAAWELALGSDGRTMLSGSNDGTVQIWDLSYESNDDIPRSPHGGTVTALAMDSKGLRAATVSCSDQSVKEAGEIKLWEMGTFQERKTLVGHRWDWVRAVAFGAAGNELASGAIKKQWSDDGSPLLKPGETPGMLKFWDLESGEELRTIETGCDGVLDVGFTEAGDVVTLSERSVVKRWNWQSGSELHTPCLHKGWTRHLLAVLRDGNKAVFRLGQNNVKLCELDPDEKIPPLLKNLGGGGFAVASDGRLAITFGPLDSLAVWNIENGERLHILVDYAGNISGVALTADSQFGISCGKDKALRVWELHQGIEICEFQAEVSFSSIALSPDDRTVVAGDEAGFVHFFKLVLPHDPN